MDSSADNPNAVVKTLTVALVVFAIGGLVMTSRQTSTSAAMQERVLENGVREHVPIKIKIKKDKEESFKDLKNKKWVREFELEVTNTGDKPIYYLYLNLITDVKLAGTRLVFNLHYGRPELGDLVSKGSPDDVPIKPKETYVFRLHPGQILAWEKGVLEANHSDATKLRASLQGLSFGDGTGFLGNTPYPPASKKELDLGLKQERRGRNKFKTLGRSTSPPNLKPNHSFATQKPVELLPVNFLPSQPSAFLSISASVSAGDCEISGCQGVIVKPAEYVCYNCPYQNRPTVSSSGICKELTYDSISCTAGTEQYLCQTITIEDCGFGSLPAPSPTPTPSPQPCLYCTDPSALGPANCADPARPRCDPFLEYQQNGCCYRMTCERIGRQTPTTPPPPCPQGYFRTSDQFQPFPLCDFYPCIPLPPGVVSDSATCQFLSYYWNFTNSTCGTSPAIGMCGGGADWSNYFSTGCYTGLGLFSGLCDRSTAFKSKCMLNGGDYNAPYCICSGCDVCGGSPILIDINGDGFAMTGVAGGVSFDLNGNGTRDPVSWTAPETDDAWLALDRNGNGTIDNGQELFGDYTLQPASPLKNGFLALAEFNLPQNGGNGDAVIDKNDAVFRQLRVWQDRNHNGLSEPSELQTLPNAGIKILELEYKMSKQMDSYGNEFKYRAKVKDANDTKIARWAWDVFLQSTGLSN